MLQKVFEERVEHLGPGVKERYLLGSLPPRCKSKLLLGSSAELVKVLALWLVR